MVGNRKPLNFKQTDLERIFRAAKAVGINARVEISKDGTYSVIPVTQQAEPPANEWDKALGKRPVKVRS